MFVRCEISPFRATSEGNIVLLYPIVCQQKSRLFMMFFLGGKPPHVKVYQAAIVSIIIGEVCRRGRN